MSSYDATDALVPPGVHVPERPGVALIPTPVAAPPQPPTLPPVIAPPTPPTSATPPTVDLHPIQPQPAQTDAVVPPGVHVPQRPGITLISAPTAPPAPAATVTQPQSGDDALVPWGVNVPERPGTTLISVPASTAAPTATRPAGAGQPERVPSSADGSGKKKPKPSKTVAQKQAAVVAMSESQKGIRYSQGPQLPGVEFDCSGLVQWTFAQIGVNLPRTSEQQYDWARKYATLVPPNKLQPGDLVFYNGVPPGHVGIYVGNGLVMQALGTKWGVGTWPLSFAGSYVGAYRIIKK